jgi:hypothetical protein
MKNEEVKEVEEIQPPKKVVIFQSTDRGGTKIFDNEGLVLHFNRMDNNLVKTDAGLTRTSKSDDWICVLEDESLIERARKIKGYSKVAGEGEFWEVDSTPTKHSVSITKKFTQAFPDQSPDVVKAVRFGELKGSLFNKSGEPKANADPALLEEYENLKKELGV